MLKPLCIVATAAVAAASGHAQANQSIEYLLDLTRSSNAWGAANKGPEPPGFDCAWRKLAYTYAPTLQALSAASSKQLHDALELTALCKVEFDAEAAEAAERAAEALAPPATAFEGASLYVDAAKGSDSSGSGSATAPFATPLRALNASRLLKCRQRPVGDLARCSVAIVLKAGTYYLDNGGKGGRANGLQLNHDDSDLTLTSTAGTAKAVLSGGVPLSGLKWSTTTHGKIMKAQVSAAQHSMMPKGMSSLRIGSGAHPRSTRARYPNANAERDLFPLGYITAKTKWLAPTWPPYNKPSSVPCPNPDGTLCGPSVTKTTSTPASEWHGMYQNYTQGYGGACEVYEDLRSPWCSQDFYLERQFQEHGNAMHTRHPSGLVAASLLPHGPYTNPQGAHVFAWRPGHWYTWMFQVGAANQTRPVPAGSSCAADHGNSTPCCSQPGTPVGLQFQCPANHPYCVGYVLNKHMGNCTGQVPQRPSQTFFFDAGGNQGGEGNDAAGEWFIENVFEELDAENEYFYDATNKMLYLWYNGTGALPPTVIVPTLADMVVLKGSAADPVSNVSITNLEFRDNRPTYMEPRSNPSGGDWSLERQGAVLLEGSVKATVRGCLFNYLDTNAVLLSGYNREAVIEGNEFVWLGQNAIASWGFLDGDGNSGLGGEQPRGTVVTQNLVHEIGHIQKQSSFYFQAITAQASITKNLVFNIPRAGINFNDGFGGGAIIEHNLLFNTCRESSDHGAFNSWDRLPYVTDVRDGHTPSTIPAVNDVHNNFIVSNYAADGGCLDNDDGSSYYAIHHNFCVYGGHKCDFDGNNKISSFNVHAYPSVYGTTCVVVGDQSLPPKGYAEGYHDNKCVLPAASAPYLKLEGGPMDVGCLAGPEPNGMPTWPSSRQTIAHPLDGSAASLKAFNDGIIVGNNSIYTVDGLATIFCGEDKLMSDKFQAAGYDTSTTFLKQMPTNEVIIGWAKGLLMPAK